MTHREDEIKYLRDIFQTSPFIMYIVQMEPEFKFVLVNDPVEDLIGYSPQEHYDNPHIAQKVIHPDYQEEMEKYVSKAMNGDSENFSLKWISKSGKPKWTEQKLVKHEIDGKTYLLGYAQDITEREQMKEEINNLKKLTRICSYCHNVFSNEKWIDINKYILNLTGGDLTHGICDKCLPNVEYE